MYLCASSEQMQGRGTKSELECASIYEGLNNTTGLGKCRFANAQPLIRRSRNTPQEAIDGYQGPGTILYYIGISILPNFGQVKPNSVKWAISGWTQISFLYLEILKHIWGNPAGKQPLPPGSYYLNALLTY